MGVLVGGESKFGSTEDEGIGGDSVEGGLDMNDRNENTPHVSLCMTTTSPDTIHKCTIGTRPKAGCL